MGEEDTHGHRASRGHTGGKDPVHAPGGSGVIDVVHGLPVHGTGRLRRHRRPTPKAIFVIVAFSVLKPQ